MLTTLVADVCDMPLYRKVGFHINTSHNYWRGDIHDFIGNVAAKVYLSCVPQAGAGSLAPQAGAGSFVPQAGAGSFVPQAGAGSLAPQDDDKYSLAVIAVTSFFIFKQSLPHAKSYFKNITFLLVTNKKVTVMVTF